MKSVTQQLAEFTAETRYEDLPERVVHEAKRVILDSFGCALAGMATSRGRIAVDFARRLGGPPESTIIGITDMVSCTGAAFANGEIITAMDYDALLKPATHVTPFVLPPALALGESRSASGKDVILAAVLGHEITSRVASGTSTFHTVEKKGPAGRKMIHGYSSNAFGSAASAGKALGLDGTRMAHCFGIAGYNSPMQASSQRNHSGTDAMTKWACAGWMAEMGTTAALLAEMGYTGDVTVLDGDYGFWRFSGSERWTPEAVVSGLGKEWHIVNMEYKRFPCCGVIPLDLFIRMVEENHLAPGEIEDVKLWLDPHANLPLWQNRQITNDIQAQFSIAYNIAVAAHRIRPGIEWQTPACMNDPRITAFMDKISVAVHPDYEKPERPSSPRSGVEVFAGGRAHAGEMPETLRAPDDKFLEDKFRHNASGVLSEKKIDGVIESIWKLDEMENISSLMKLTAQPPFSKGESENRRR
ncbi:MAG: MmgE/PrpD family protein [Chloroflexi bacterium]|nr:MmgE/PrpD family protein [Chloroflexota bacterium]